MTSAALHRTKALHRPKTLQCAGTQLTTARLIAPPTEKALDEFALPALVSASDLPDALQTVAFMLGLVLLPSLGFLLVQHLA